MPVNSAPNSALHSGYVAPHNSRGEIESLQTLVSKSTSLGFKLIELAGDIASPVASMELLDMFPIAAANGPLSEEHAKNLLSFSVDAVTDYLIGALELQQSLGREIDCQISRQDRCEQIIQDFPEDSAQRAEQLQVLNLQSEFSVDLLKIRITQLNTSHQANMGQVLLSLESLVNSIDAQIFDGPSDMPPSYASQFQTILGQVRSLQQEV